MDRQDTGADGTMYNDSAADLRDPPTFEDISSRRSSYRDAEVGLARIETLRLTQKSTVGSTTGPAPRSEWLPFGDGKDYPPLLPDPEKYVVGFNDANDPSHPHNWPTSRK